jgi:hypothetical protein
MVKQLNVDEIRGRWMEIAEFLLIRGGLQPIGCCIFGGLLPG